MTNRPRRTTWSLAACALGLAAFTAGAASAAPQDEADAALRDYFSANGLLNRGLHDLAASEYRSFLADHADHEKAPTARYGLGVCLFRLGRHEEAIAALDAVRGRRTFAYAPEVGTMLGQCHLALGRPGDAVAPLTEVMRGHADHALADEAAALLVEAYYSDGRHEEVPPVSRTLAERWPTSPLRERTELFAGLSEMALGEYPAAAQRFESMRETFPRGAYAEQTSLLLAQSLHRTRMLPRALEQYRAVVRTASDAYLPDALYGLALLLNQQGQGPGAARRLDEMIERFPDHDLATPARLLRGRIHFDQAQYDDARRHLDRVAKLDGADRAEAEYWLAKCDLREDDPAAAADRLAAVIAAHPKSELMAEMMYDRAVASSRADDADAAMEQLRRFRERFPKHTLAPAALHLMAATEHGRTRYAESRRLARRFAAEYGDHELAAPVAFLGAESAFLDREYDTAAKAYATFLAEHPEDDQRDAAAFRLGMAQYRLGQYDAAEPILAGVARGRRTEPRFRTVLLALGDLHFQRGEMETAAERLSDYVSFGEEQPSADDALLKLGLANDRLDRHEPALAAFKRLLAEHPDSPHAEQARFERGQTLVAMRREDEATPLFHAIVDADHDSRFAVHALNHLATIALNDGDHETAAGLYARIAARDDGGDDLGAESLFQQGQAYMALKRYDEAAAVFRTLVRTASRSPRIAAAQGQLALALARQDEPDAALAQIALVERRHSGDLDAELRAAIAYEKAWCYRALKRPDDAAAAYGELLALDGPSALRGHARLELAELKTTAGDHAAAAALLRELLADDPGSPAPDAALTAQAHYRLGASEYEQRRFAQAAEVFGRFVVEHPRSDRIASASLLCGESLFRTGNHRRAVTHLERVVNQHRADAACSPALLRLGECQAALQLWPASAASFDRHRKQFPKSEQWYQAQFGIGWAHENQGRFAAAIDAYRKVTDRHQGATAARAQFQVGECLYAQKKHEKAIRELLKVDILYAFPEWSAAALYEAGRCFHELNKTAEALAHFEQVAREHGETQWGRLAAGQVRAISRGNAAAPLPGRRAGTASAGPDEGPSRPGGTGN